MSKIGLIIEREYLSRVAKRSFIILAFLAPILMVALIFTPLLLSSINDNEVKEIVVVDYSGKYKNAFVDNENFHFSYFSDSTSNRTNNHEQLLIVITANLLENPNAITIYSDKQVSNDLKNHVRISLKELLETEKLASYDIPNIKDIIADSKVNLNITTIRTDKEGGETASSTELATIVGMVTTMLIYMFILIYGAMVMQAVMQEKTNRIVEVLISSIKPFDLMMGKIIAIGLVGLTQLAIWAISVCGISAFILFIITQTGGGISPESIGAIPINAPVNMDASALTSQFSLQALLSSINLPQILIAFLFYFIGGFLLYSALFAAIGSAVDNETDTQQFMVPITILIVFALYAGIYSINNPDGPLAFWCSMIPFTSPIVMMTRIPFGVPMWQIILSYALLTMAFVGTTWVSARIYRVGILMYGKKPSIKELIKWIKY